LAGVLALWAASVSLCRTPGGESSGRFVGLRPLVVDLNRAPPRLLILLPGIGPARAAAIVKDRRRLGPYAAIEDLVRVHGIGPATVRGLAGLARVR